LVTDALLEFLFTLDFTAWYGTSSLLTILSFTALTFYAFRCATAGKPLFAELGSLRSATFRRKNDRFGSLRVRDG
jgi:hypothetical protein